MASRGFGAVRRVFERCPNRWRIGAAIGAIACALMVGGCRTASAGSSDTVVESSGVGQSAADAPNLAQTPELGSLVLFGTAAAGLGVYFFAPRRRRRRIGRKRSASA